MRIYQRFKDLCCAFTVRNLWLVLVINVESNVKTRHKPGEFVVSKYDELYMWSTNVVSVEQREMGSLLKNQIAFVVSVMTYPGFGTELFLLIGGCLGWVSEDAVEIV